MFKQLRELKEYFIQLANKQPEQPELFRMINEAHGEWVQALEQLDNCDPDMLEYVIHEVQAKERRYMALMMQARQEGLTAWKAHHLATQPCPNAGTVCIEEKADRFVGHYEN